MKTLFTKPDQPNERKSSGNRTPLFLMTFVFLFISFVLSGSSPVPQKNNKAKEPGNKKLDILEKLENGGTINSEDIKSIYGDFRIRSNENKDINYPVISDIPDISFPDKYTFPEHYYYRYHDGKDHKIISDSDLEEVHKQLSDSMAELKKDIESISTSEDFLIMRDNLKRWNDNFRKEIDKMKEELIRSSKNIRSKETDHINM